MIFVNAPNCPFAQRTWMALLEKGAQFERRDIELQDPTTGTYLGEHKPDWFLDMNPLGRVPVLATEDGVIYESTVCNEWLEELFPEPPLLPREPFARARARLIIERFNQRYLPPFYHLLGEPEDEARRAITEQFCAELDWLESQVSRVSRMSQTSGKKPGFLGQSISLVDCALLPFFKRHEVLEHYRGFQLPDSCPRLREWYEAASQQPSFVATCVAPEGQDSYDDYLIRMYDRYANDPPRGAGD